MPVRDNLPEDAVACVDDVIGEVVSDSESTSKKDIEREVYHAVSTHPFIDRLDKELHITTHNVIVENHPYMNRERLDPDDNPMVIKRETKKVLVDFLKRETHKEVRRQELISDT